MQPTNRINQDLAQSIKQEHYRWHNAEQWADSPYKDAVLAAVHSTLERLESALEPFEPPACMICSSRKTPAKVLQFPSGPKHGPAMMRQAA